MSYVAFLCFERLVLRVVTHGTFSSPLKGEGYITRRLHDGAARRNSWRIA
jgi:hypothetical protein